MDERDTEQKVRERAYLLWIEEGKPEGRAAAHWDMASELVAIEENQRDTLLPNPKHDTADTPATEAIEALELERNLGEFPTLTDQGEEATTPDAALVQGAAEAPLRSGSGSRKKRSG